MSEEKEFEELALLEEFEKEERRKGYAPSVQEMDEARAAVEPSTGEALATGFVEGTPFLKDAVSAYDGIVESMEDDDVSFDEAYGNYKENLDEANQSIQASKEHAPFTTAAGEIAATVPQLALGGAALKGAGAAKVLTKKGMDVAAAVGVGAAQQLSRSTDRGISDVVVGGAIGGVSEVASQYAVTGIKKGGRYLLDKADDLGSKAAKKLLGIGNASTNRQLFKHLKRTNQKESEFMSNVLTQRMKNGEQVIDFGEKPQLMLDKVKVRKEEIGKDIGKLYKEMDAAHDIQIDLEDLKAGLSDDVVAPFLRSDDPGMQQIGMDLEGYIQSLGRKVKSIKKEVTPEGTKLIEDVTQDPHWNLTRVHKLQKDIRKRIETIYKKNGMDLNASKEQQKRVASSLGKHMDEVLDHVSTDADDVIGAIRKDRLEFGNMATIEDSIEAEMFRSHNDPTSMLKEALGFRSMMISGMATSVAGPAGLVAGPILNKVIASPKTPLYMATGVKKIGSIIKSAPTGEIATRLNTAAMMTNQKFKDTLYGTIAEINLQQQPVPRSVKNIKLRHADLRHLVKMQQPSALKDFDNAFENGSDQEIGQLMDMVSKIPGADKMFEPGIGIDGVVYSPEDKQTLELQLKQSDIPGAQRIQMLNALRSNGIVPDIEGAIEPEPKVHVPTARKIHDY